MARVEDSALHNFTTGETVTENTLDQNFKVLQTAVNSNDKVLADLGINNFAPATFSSLLQTSTTFNQLKFGYVKQITDPLAARVTALEMVDTKPPAIEEIIATAEGQTVFTLVSDTYQVGKGEIEVEVSGVPQFSGEGFTETDSKTITLAEGVPAGTVVRAIISQTPTALSDKLAKYDEFLAAIAINVKSFGAKGDGVTDDTQAIQAAINYCYTNNIVLNLGNSTYRTYSLVFKCNMVGNGAILLFNEGSNFTNYELDGSIRYAVTSLKGIVFESDKSAHWNATEAGQSWDAAVTNAVAKRMYGQRIYIGNKTQTPNNICSPNSPERLAGTGYVYNDNSQWMNIGSELNLNDIDSSYGAITNRSDTNKITALDKGITIENCEFIGWKIGLSIYATYNSTLRNNKFKRCAIGVDTRDGSYLPNALSDANAKVTTVNIDKAWFEDISLVGIWAYSLLQTKIRNVIFQPCKLGIVLYSAADNDIEDNYFEIGYALVHIGSNDASNNIIKKNFCNTSYSTYQVYTRYGVKNKVGLCRGKGDVFAHAAITNCDFDYTCTVTRDPNFFHVNGNSVDREKAKVAVFTTTGTGDKTGTVDIGITTAVKFSTRFDNSTPKLTTSQTGLYFNGNESVLAIEIMTDENNIARLSYYDPNNTGDGKVMYVDQWDNTNKVYVRKDIRDSGAKFTWRVSFTDGLS